MGNQCSSSSSEPADLAKVERMKTASRRPGFSAETVSDEQISSWKRPISPKRDSEYRRIESLIRSNKQLQVLFGSLMDDSMRLRHVIEAMSPRVICEGETIIKQGDPGDAFYIVDEGTFDISVSRGDGPSTKVLSCGPGSSFGELALMWNAPRAATVVATSPGHCWCLDRESFRMMLVTTAAAKLRETESFLAKVPILQELNRYELGQLADIVQTIDIPSFASIVEQGDIGSEFFILASGSATAFIDGPSGRLAVKTYAIPGDYFGEVALLGAVPRQASVIAGDQGCRALKVHKDDFNRVLGPITARLKDKADAYPAYSEFLSK